MQNHSCDLLHMYKINIITLISLQDFKKKADPSEASDFFCYLMINIDETYPFRPQKKGFLQKLLIFQKTQKRHPPK